MLSVQGAAKKDSVAGAEWVKQRVVGDEIRDRWRDERQIMKDLLDDYKEFDFYFDKNDEPLEDIKQ